MSSSIIELSPEKPDDDRDNLMNPSMPKYCLKIRLVVTLIVVGLGLPVSVPAEPRRIDSENGIVVYSSGRPPAVSQAVIFAFDDISIPFRQNLCLQMHAADKYPGNPVLKRGASGTPDSYRAQLLGTVLKIDGKFKMWYIAADDEATASYSHLVAHLPESGTKSWRVAYAESDDGIHWSKPNLGLVEYHGNRNNNLVQLPLDLGGWHLIIIHEADDPDPARRFKMMLMTRSDRGSPSENTSASVPLFSADGLRWRFAVKTRIIDGFVPLEDIVTTKEFLEQGGLYHWREMYYLTGQQGYPSVWLPDGEQCGRVMSVFRSPDFIHWFGSKSLGFVRYGYRSAPIQEAEESHEPGGIWQRGNVLVGIYGLFHGAPNAKWHPMDLGFLISDDAIHFREPQPDFVFIPRGKAGSFESRGLIQSNGFENIGDKTYFWYGGWDGDVTNPDVHSEVGLATLRRDGFGSLSTISIPDAAIRRHPSFFVYPSGPATFVTCPIEVKNSAELWLNAEGLSESARLRLELLDENENALPGYSQDSSIPVERSGVRVHVSWKDRDRISAPARPFKIKVGFEGQNRDSIKFYALYLSQTAP